MAQYKSRAVDSGRFDVVEDGLRRLSGGNEQVFRDLADQFQFDSRNAGRIDLGGSWHTIGGRTPQERADNVMLDGLARTEMPALVRGHPAQVRQAVETLQRLITSADPTERQGAALRLMELQSALPYANGESAGIINQTMADVGIDFNETRAVTRTVRGADGTTSTVTEARPVSLEEQLARMVGPGGTADDIRTNARVYDQQRGREELGGVGPGATPPPPPPAT